MEAHALQLSLTLAGLEGGAIYESPHGRQCEAEKRLLIAVLKDAVLEYKRHRYRPNTRFREAESWLFDADSDRLFAFKTVCDILGLSADRIRTALRTTGSQHPSDWSDGFKSRPFTFRHTTPRAPGMRSCRFSRQNTRESTRS